MPSSMLTDPVDVLRDRAELYKNQSRSLDRRRDADRVRWQVSEQDELPKSSFNVAQSEPAKRVALKLEAVMRSGISLYRDARVSYESWRSRMQRGLLPPASDLDEGLDTVYRSLMETYQVCMEVLGTLERDGIEVEQEITAEFRVCSRELISHVACRAAQRPIGLRETILTDEAANQIQEILDDPNHPGPTIAPLEMPTGNASLLTG